MVDSSEISEDESMYRKIASLHLLPAVEPIRAASPAAGDPVATANGASQSDPTEARLDQALVNRRRDSKALGDYFVGNLSVKEEELVKTVGATPWRSKVWQESVIGELAQRFEEAGVIGSERIVHSGGSQKPIQTEDDRTEKDDKAPDLVVLTKPAASPDLDYKKIWSTPPTGEDRRSWEQVAVVGEFKQASSTSASKQGKKARAQMDRRLYRLWVTPIRLYVFGFTVVDEELIVYLRTHSALYNSPPIPCSHNTLCILLHRLLDLSDTQLGIFATQIVPPIETTSPLQLYGPSLDGLKPIPLSAKNPRRTSRKSNSGITSIRITKVFARRFQPSGRATSTFRADVSYATEGGHDGRAVSFTFAEEDRHCDHDLIRTSIANAPLEEREGLSRTVGLFRGSFSLGAPSFLAEAMEKEEKARKAKVKKAQQRRKQKDGAGENKVAETENAEVAKAEETKAARERSPNLLRRALEVTIYEEPFSSIYTVASAKQLVEVMIGAVTGHMNLYKLGFLQADPSDTNIMVDSSGGGRLTDYNLAIPCLRDYTIHTERSGTFPFLARAALDPDYEEKFKHGIWHDIESFVYVGFAVGFRKSPTSAPKGTMSKKARDIWIAWDSSNTSFAFKTTLKNDGGIEKAVDGCQKGWEEAMPKLVDILRSFCGLRPDLAGVNLDKEEKAMRQMWAEPEGVYVKMIKELTALSEKL
ncbi:Protein kinase-like protein [Pseudohyphozyma bogoriensis]|nr:Protein kinase-like protein [Pseudohyphozyma bogoriensis]